MKDLTELHNLKFSSELANFVENELLPGLDISSDDFWSSLSKIFYEFRVENENFLRTREEIQNKIDFPSNKYENNTHLHEFSMRIDWKRPRDPQIG